MWKMVMKHKTWVQSTGHGTILLGSESNFFFLFVCWEYTCILRLNSRMLSVGQRPQPPHFLRLVERWECVRSYAFSFFGRGTGKPVIQPPRAEKGLTPTECLETACKNAEDPEEEQEYEMTQPARHAQMPPRMRAMQMCLVTLGSSRLTTGHSYAAEETR